MIREKLTWCSVYEVNAGVVISKLDCPSKLILAARSFPLPIGFEDIGDKDA